MAMKIFKSLFFILFFCGDIFCAEISNFISANSFDGFAPSSRSRAMGGAGVGLKNSNEAFFYNAASLAYNKGSVFEFSVSGNAKGYGQNYAAQTEGTGLASAFFVKDFVSFSWQSLSDIDIEVKNSDGTANKTESSINSVKMSFGKESPNGFASGWSLSYIYGHFAASGFDGGGEPYSNLSSGNGFAFDVSWLIPFYKKLNLGIQLKNLGVMFWENYSAQTIPCSLLSGIGYSGTSFSFSLDFNNYFYRYGNLEKEIIRCGAEKYITEYFCLRAGVFGANMKKMSYSYGTEIKFKKCALSFAGEQNNSYSENFVKYMLSFSLYAGK
jgi:hypothetical protein